MAPEVVQFGDITVDLRRMSVSRAGQPVSLEPKAFDVLRYLIEHRDRLVTKEELLDAVWKDTFVTPNVLTRAVAQMRKALGDDAFEAKYVETAAKRGYRFIAPVQVFEPAAGARADASTDPEKSRAVTDPVPATSPRSRTLAFVALAVSALVLAAAGLGVYAFRTRTVAASVEEPIAPLSPRRLTTDNHSYSFPSISPDGRTVAYSSDRSGSLEIYTSGFASGSKELALTSDGGHNMFAEWSPDGQWIAYHSRKKAGIWIVPASGGTARQVVDFGSQPAWTPDGRQIVFTSDAGGMAAQSVLWIVSRDGGDARPLTKLGAPRGGHAKPAVSPAGSIVAFAVSHGHITTEIWTATIDGTTSTKLGTGASPHFSGDGSAVYWVGRTLEGNDALMRVGLNADGTPAGDPQMVQTFPGTFIGDFSIARDGTSVLWLFRTAANLWSVDVPARGMARPVPLTADDVRNTQPRHSRSGLIAFTQLSAGHLATTWVIDEDGKNREALTVGLTVGVWGAQWSADEKRMLVFTGTVPNRTWAFGWLDVATRQISPVPVSAHGALNPHLSPDGREIAFHVIDEGGVINVWRQPLDGGARKQVTFDSEAMSYPSWSPDGASLAIEIKRGDHTHIGVMPKDGGPVEVLVAEKGQSWPFSWSPDNDRIAFAGARDGVWNVYTVSRASKEIRQITSFTSVEGYVRYPSWSRTRESIVFERAEQRGSLWTVRLP